MTGDALCASVPPDALAAFAAEVGPSGPVRVLGGDTHELVGGRPDGDARVVRAPSGVVDHQPADMTVQVGAGTRLSDLQDHLAAAGQRVVLDGPAGATVGGVLAVGRSGIRRRGDGHVRNALLGAQIVDHTGTLVTIGGSTVKNVTGYDLCRLMVGSLGTLGCLGEVILKCVPIAPCSSWVVGAFDAATAPEATQCFHRPTSVLCDGTSIWVLVEGADAAVAAELRRGASVGFVASPGGPPARPSHRLSVAPSRIAATVATLDGPFLAEVGVGVIHTARPREQPGPEAVPLASPAIVAVHRRLRDQFDPDRRFNPGRDPLAAAS